MIGLLCTHCSGAGKLKEPCEACASSGYRMPAGFSGWYACACSNLWCIKCGGTGRRILPRQVPG